MFVRSRDRRLPLSAFRQKIIIFRFNILSIIFHESVNVNKTPAQAFTPPAEKKIGTKWTFMYIHATAQAGENIK